MSALAAILLLAAAPAGMAATDARTVAESGTLATILPMMEARQTEDLVRAHPELTAAEQAELRAIAGTVGADMRTRVRDAEAATLVETLSGEDLAALAAFSRTPAAIHMRREMPRIAAAAARAMNGLDFAGSVSRAFCARRGKLC